MNRLGYRASGVIIAAVCAFSFAPIAFAQPAPADLATMPAIPKTYVPVKTPWGDPDFRGTFPLEPIDQSRIRLTRPKEFGNRFWVTDAEFAMRLDAAKKSDAAYSAEYGGRGTKGLAEWMANPTSPIAPR